MGKRTASPRATSVGALHPSALHPGVAGRLLNGRYALLELIGRGGMGVVYRATDTHEGRDVALKVMRKATFDTTSVALFKSEFRTLSSLGHPHIARVYDFAACSDTLDYFFTMELVPGVDAIAATERATHEQIVELMVQVTRALAYLHTRNIVHLDLKPANILVTSDFRPKIVDFGISRSPDVARRRVYGTPSYMAPELLLEGGEVDRRADLYGLGATLFRLLFRRVPGGSSDEASRGASCGDPGWMEAELARIPPWLATLLRRLMARTPAERYRSASEVIAAIDLGRGSRVELETTETSGSYVASARLVGLESILGEVMGTLQQRLSPAHARHSESAIDWVDACALPPASASAAGETLIATREQASRATAHETRDLAPLLASPAVPSPEATELIRVESAPAFVLMCVGPEGAGKSRVLAEVRLECQLSRSRLVEEACVADTLEPFVVWASIAKQLLTSLEAPPASMSTPFWKPAPMGPAAGGELVGEAAFWAAQLTALFLAQASPCVVAIDDLHWMDPRALEVFELLLENLSQRGNGRATCITFLCATRDELPAESARTFRRLERLGLSRELRFPALSAAQVGELVTSMLGTVELPIGLPEAIASATQGNALQVAELLRAWVAEGTVQPRAAGWTFQGSSTAGELTQRIQRLFEDELRQLSSDELELLRLLAVLGEPAPPQLLQEILGLEREALLTTVGGLRARRIVHLARGEVVCFSASRWRSSVLATLGSVAAAAVHRRIAHFLEGREPGDAVALHYERGTDLALAAEWYTRGAEEWLAEGDFRRAVRCFQRATNCGASDSTLGRACSAAAEASRMIGDRARAAALAERALALLPAGSQAWMRASRVAIAAFNPGPR
jgi:hypothetical protein